MYENDLTAPNLLVENIKQHNLESIHQQMESLSSDPELRDLIDTVSHARFNTNAPLYESGDFEGMRRAMDVLDGRTAKDGTYRERQDAEVLVFDEETDDTIYRVAEKFGLTGDSIPKAKEAAAALVLGGAGKSPLDRTAYTKELLDKGQLQTNSIILLASDRPVNDDEIKRGGNYAVGAKTEFDLNVKACEKVFGVTFEDSDITVGTDPSVPEGLPDHWRVAHQTSSDGKELFVISAPVTTDPFEVRNGNVIRRPRANTRDTYAMLMKLGGFKPGEHVVGVTNAHFVPFQGADAIGQLGSFGIDTEVVGYDPSHFGNPRKTSQELLQEMLTAADSLAKASM